jgi:hypothetical protein
MTTQTLSFSSGHSTHVIPHHIVTERAYAIWLAQGQPSGCDYDHWVEAELQLLASRPQEHESISSRLHHWDDPLGTDIERALDSLTPSLGQRSVTSL